MIPPKLYLNAMLAAIRPPMDIAHVKGASILARMLGYRVGKPISEQQNADGDYWPQCALTMIGLDRLNALCKSAQAMAGRGDFVEVGVWRGGALCWLAALAQCYSPTSRVIGFDTFDGFREHDAHDRKDYLSRLEHLRVSEQEVWANLQRFGLEAALVKGDCRETLKEYSGDIAVLRVDVDQYEPTYAALELCLPHLVPGAHVHLDDHYMVDGARMAFLDFCRHHGFRGDTPQIDKCSALWIYEK